MDDTLIAARSGDADAFRRLTEPFRRELKAHCYRMSGSLHDADDLLQESLIRAWKGLPGFEGRSSVRSWLYRVTTHACLDQLEQRPLRVLPMGLGPASEDADVTHGAGGEPLWLEPFPDVPEESGDPEARLTQRESVALAFLTVLQRLPPRQRAVLLLRDVVGLDAAECAEELDTSVAAVNSALQRARETLDRESPTPQLDEDEESRALLARYVRAWEDADVDALVALLRDDATLQMPPLPGWLQGAANIRRSIGAMVFTPEARGAFRLVPTRANGQPAFAAYRRDASGVFAASGVHVLGLAAGRVVSIDAFLTPSLVTAFGLPASAPH